MIGAYGVTALQKKGFAGVAGANIGLADRAKNRFQGRKARGILGYERSKFLPFGCERWVLREKFKGKTNNLLTNFNF